MSMRVPGDLLQRRTALAIRDAVFTDHPESGADLARKPAFLNSRPAIGDQFRAASAITV
jgi:hypothetical protein